MSFLRARRPSISVLLWAMGVILVLPLIVVGSAQLRSSSEKVESAELVQDSASRLALLVRLGPALNSELLATGITAGQLALFDDVPGDGAFAIFDEAVPLAEAQASVDELLALLDEEDLLAEVHAAREQTTTDSEDPIANSSPYDDVRLSIASRREQELLRLNSAAVATGSSTIGQAAQLAIGAADLQGATVQLDGTWALLEASPYLAPRAEDVPRLGQGVAAYLERSALFESVAPDTGPIRDAWDDVNTSEEFPRLFEAYSATADRFVRDGLDRSGRPGEVEFSPDQWPQLLVTAARIQDGFRDSAVLNDKLTVLVDESLKELSSSAQISLDEATRERQITVASLVGAGAFALLAGLFSMWFVGRPIEQLAAAATRMSLGDLDVELPERGPSEVRIGARAINEAVASLRHVEDQATALAEQRLDDPVLDDAAPGALGASLQVAVSRLADSFNERDEIRAKLEYEAGHDSLTKLANRRTLFDNLANNRKATDLYGLMFLDLDGFKSLNDTYGHHVGDIVLQVLAERILACIGGTAIAARLGGDEFVVVTENLASGDEAFDIAKRLHALATSPIELGDTRIKPDISIGVTVSDASRTPAQMLRDADLALYRAKVDNEQDIVLCNDELRLEADRRTDLENALIQGLHRDEFLVHYQTLVSATEKSMTDVEALIRWHPSGEGVVSPGEFIPVAEQSDLVIELDCWVLDHVGEQLGAGSFAPDVRVSVNISGRHLSSGKLAVHVAEVIDNHGIDPGRLIVEITETSLLDDFETAARDLARLRSLGVSVALDDFGTGFMSLAYLRTLPVDILKIDKSFVDEVESTEGASFVQLIVDTGHLLDLSIVAEGVETARQAELLTEMGVDVLQGFWFGKAEPLAQDHESTPTARVA